MPSRILLLLPWTLASGPALACSGCRTLVLAGIFDGGFTQRLLVLVLPVLVLFAIAGALLLSARRPRAS